MWIGQYLRFQFGETLDFISMISDYCNISYKKLTTRSILWLAIQPIAYILIQSLMMKSEVDDNCCICSEEYQMEINFLSEPIVGLMLLKVLTFRLLWPRLWCNRMIGVQKHCHTENPCQTNLPMQNRKKLANQSKKKKRKR